MDPIEKLFRDLPSPAADQAALVQDNISSRDHFSRVFASFSPSQSSDPDRDFIEKLAKHFVKTREYEMLRSVLGWFALHKHQIPDDGSAKSQQLRYHKWIYQGRKDEEYPFRNEERPEGHQVDVPQGGHAFLPAKMTDTRICANCVKPDAKAACSGCLLELDSHVVMKTSYCNSDCQTQHWKEHKSRCMGRRKIYRAVSLIYDLFVVFQKNAWFNKLTASIAEGQGTTEITIGHGCDWACQGKHFISCFPSTLAPSEDHAHAVLMNGGNTKLLWICQDLVKLLLLPLCQTLQEVNIAARNAHRPNCCIEGDAVRSVMYIDYPVLCATLKSGEQIVVDIAGAQFGWRETVAEWGVWSSHRVAGKSLPQPFGNFHQYIQMMYPFFAPQHGQVSVPQELRLAQKMCVAIHNTMKENDVPSAGDLYKLNEAAFASCKLAMLSTAEEAIHRDLRELYETKVGFSYLDARAMVRATTSKEQAEALEQVWLTDEDMKKAEEDGTDWRVIYVSRCRNEVTRQKCKAAGLDMP
ncbi:hypothetical protein F5Y03DRAFT_404868 [Xylaria venustula]|nr:hypothetical protein F5Y03DRAFT_404868 [Xylaria venustula]